MRYDIACPWCESEDIEMQLQGNEQPEGYPVAVVCTECGATGPITFTSTEIGDCDLHTFLKQNDWGWRRPIRLPSIHIPYPRYETYGDSMVLLMFNAQCGVVVKEGPNASYFAGYVGENWPTENRLPCDRWGNPHV